MAGQIDLAKEASREAPNAQKWQKCKMWDLFGCKAAEEDISNDHLKPWVNQYLIELKSELLNT